MNINASGIILFGAPGVGDTTLGRALAEQLALPHFDLDDYHWRWDTEIPYTIFRLREERAEHIMRDIAGHLHFVMSGSMWSIRERFNSLFELAVFITAPAEVRAERLRARELARWGSRVLPGGDIYQAHDHFHRDYFTIARQYEAGGQPCLAQHEQWAAELPCPVLRVDGTKPVAENAVRIAQQWRQP